MRSRFAVDAFASAEIVDGAKALLDAGDVGDLVNSVFVGDDLQSPFHQLQQFA